MACVGSPTRTLLTTITSVGHSISFSSSVSSVPAILSTTVLVSCSTVSSAVNCVSSTQVNTIPGALTTIQVPFTVDVPVIETLPTETLFAPCLGSSTPPPPSSTSLVISQSTPLPMFITSETSSTMADGSIVVQTLTITSTQPPTAVYVPTVVPANQQQHNNSSHGVNIAPIIGGVVGGFFGLIGIVAVLWFFLRKRPSWGDIFEAEDSYVPAPIRSTRDKRRRIDLDLDVQPKPYQYGLVGHVNSATLTSPPGSPTSTHPPLSSHSPSWHGRHRSSLTPLLVPSVASTPGASMPATASSRPSTAGSFYPLRPQSQHGQHASSTKSAADEFGARPVSAPSYPQNGTWQRTSPPIPLMTWNSMNDRPSTAPAAGPNRRGSPVSFQEPRMPLQIVNAALSPAASAETVGEVGMQQNEGAPSQLGSPLGPNGGQVRSSNTYGNDRKMNPEETDTALGAPPSYEA